MTTDRAGKNPFKGLTSYEEVDRNIFFGRDRESGELAGLVELNRLTVVFGKSGIGKTSLLNAGLFPLLREGNFLPVRIRLNYGPDGGSLLRQVREAMADELRAHGIRKVKKGETVPADAMGEEESLWEYFRRVDHINSLEKGPLETVTPVLVLDQFEEFFTLGKHHRQREDLVSELYWLVEDQAPPALKERILARREVFPYLRESPAFRLVLGLREDYLPHLDELKQRIPSLHRVLYRVLHLNGSQAREVMERSGAFSDEAIKTDILDQFYPGDMEPGKVPEDRLEVEPALFSLLCEQVYEKGVVSLTKQAREDILAGFYDEILGQLPGGEGLAEWIEDHLLTEGGFRTPFYLERGSGMRGGIDAAIDKKLLRKLYIGGKEHVEIIHDVLAPVIHRRRKRRTEERKRKRMIAITAIISMVAITSIFLTVFAFIQMNRADVQYKAAVSNRLASEAELVLPKDHSNAIRIAGAAYKIGLPSPSAPVVRALCSSAYSSRGRPFYRASLSHEDIVRTAVFSPDGSRVLTASWDNTAKLWDMEGEILAEFKGHTDTVRSAVFSPDGSRVLTASYDNTAKLWDMEGKIMAEFKGHNGSVYSAVFSPDGKHIVTASTDNTAIIWPTPETIMEYLETAPIPKLTAEEKKELGIEDFNID